MDNKTEIKNLLIDSLGKSFLLPIREILKVDDIPQSIWRDSFLVSFFLTHIGEYANIIHLESGVHLDSDEFSDVIKQSDPANYEFILNIFEGEIDIESDDEAMKKGEDIAKRHIYLGFRNKMFVPFEFNDDDDEYIKFAHKKAEVMKEILFAAYPGSPVIENMTRDDAASQALVYYEVFEYVKDNKEKFLLTDENKIQEENKSKDNFTPSNQNKPEDIEEEKIAFEEVYEDRNPEDETNIENIKYHCEIKYEINPLKTASDLFLATMHYGSANPRGHTFANALSGYKKLATVPRVKEIIEGFNVNLQSKYTFRDVTQGNYNWNVVLNKNISFKNPYVYVLLLRHGRIYVGYSKNIIRRLNQHIRTSDDREFRHLMSEPNEISAFWVHRWGLENILCIYENGDEKLENELTLYMMSKYEWNNVRGGDYVKDKLEYPFKL